MIDREEDRRLDRVRDKYKITNIRIDDKLREIHSKGYIVDSKQD